MLRTTICGLRFPNCVGLAAGLDKNAEAIGSFMKMGFGFVEVGTITPLPQPGNPKPRMFRIPEHLAIINRFGFNSVGQTVVLERLKNFYASANHIAVLGVNIGKNKKSPNTSDDYKVGMIRMAPYSDFMVINISSPNTPDLRSFQRKEQLSTLLTDVINTRNEMDWTKRQKPPIFVKIAPDLSDEERRDIADVVLNVGIDGMIISNTTISRPPYITNKVVNESGGLSGKPLGPLSTAIIKDMYKYTNGKVPIIGVGGIMGPEDAYEKIRAGASAIEIYTSMVYAGPGLIPHIRLELASLLQKDGFKNVSEAVGVDVVLDNNSKVNNNNHHSKK